MLNLMLIHTCVLINQPMTFPKCWTCDQGRHLWPPPTPQPPWSRHLTAPWSAMTRTSSSWSVVTPYNNQKDPIPIHPGLWWHEPSEGGSFGKAEGARQLPSSTKASGNFLNIFNLKNICEIDILKNPACFPSNIVKFPIKFVSYILV